MLRKRQTPKKEPAGDPAYRNFVRREYQRRRGAINAKSAAAQPPEEPVRPDPGRIYALIRKNALFIAPVVLAAVLVVVLFPKVIAAAIGFATLLVLASYSTVYKKSMGMPLGGIELVTFGTVVTGAAIHPLAGLAFGLASSAASEIISANIGPMSWLYFVTMAAAGFLSGVFGNLPVLVLGMSATVMAIVVNQIIYLFIGDAEIKNFTVFYIFANVAFNLLLFATLGAKAVALLS